jgi:hypothetical protein
MFCIKEDFVGLLKPYYSKLISGIGSKFIYLQGVGTFQLKTKVGGQKFFAMLVDTFYCSNGQVNLLLVMQLTAKGATFTFDYAGAACFAGKRFIFTAKLC